MDRVGVTTTGGTGIDLTGGSGTFALSNITLNTAAGTGLNVTGGGTLTVTGSANSIATTTGTAVNLDAVAVGAAGATFRSVSADGAASGIVLNDVSGAGVFAVTGTGTAGSGGTVQNTTGPAVRLTNSAALSLSNMSLRNGAARAVDASAGGTSALTLTVDRCVISNFPVAGTVQAVVAGTAAGRVTVTNNAISGSGGTAVEVQALDAADLTAGVTGNDIAFAVPAAGSSGVNVSGRGDPTGLKPFEGSIAYTVSGNTIQRATGLAINVILAPPYSTAGGMVVQGGGDAAGRIENNVIGNSNETGSGGAGGINIESRGNASSVHTTLIRGNQIRRWGGTNALLVTVGEADSASTLNATVVGNTMAEPEGTANNAILFYMGVVPTSRDVVCLNLGGVGSLANIVAGAGLNGSTDIRLRQREKTTVMLRGYTGSNNGNGAVATYVSGNNGGASVSVANTVSSGGGGYVNTPGGGPCPQPLLLTTPAAAAESSGPPPTATAATVPVVDDGRLREEDLAAAVAAAIDRWAAAGLTADQLDLLRGVPVSVADLPGWYLGAAWPGAITLDADAAGHGWFLDPTPADDSEFPAVLSPTRLVGGPDGRLDLLTTVMHEFGHALGLGDSYALADRDDLMYGHLVFGERRLPAFGRAVGAVPDGNHPGPEFIGGPVSIGTLDAGTTITVRYRATVNSPFPSGVTQVSNQGTVSGTGFADVPTDDPAVGGTADPTVTPIVVPNTPPDLTASGGAASYTENAAAVPIDPGAGVSDAEGNWAGGTLTAQITVNPEATDRLSLVAGGDVTLGGLAVSYQGAVVGTVTAASAAGGGVLTITFNAAATNAAVQAVARAVGYDSTSNDPAAAARTVTLTLTDAAAGADAATRVVSVTPLNDPPALTPPAGTTLAYSENQPAAAIDATLTVADPDTPQLAGATVQVTGGFVPTEDVLAFTPFGGIGGSYNPTAGILSLTGTATLAAYQTVLRSVTYANTGENPSTVGRVVTFTLNDGAAANNTGTATRTITVAAVNDPPTVGGVGGAVGYTENDPATVLAAGATVADPDSPDLDGGSLTVDFTTGGSADDRLAVRHQGTGAGQVGVSGSNLTFGGIPIGTVAGGVGTAPLVVTFSAGATPAAVEAVVRSVTYRNVSDTPATTPRTVRFVVADGGGGSSDPAATTVNVSAVNDPPAGTITGVVVDPREGTAIALGSDFSDRDGDALTYSWPVTKDGQPYTPGTPTDGAAFSFTPGDNGRYVVTLIATDPGTASGSDARAIDVRNVVPVPAVPPAAGVVHTPVSVPGSFADAAGAADGGFTYRWRVLRGTTELATSGDPAATGYGAVPPFSFTPPAAGRYTAELTVADKDAGSGTGTAGVEVAAVFQTITRLDATPTAATAVRFRVMFSDPVAGLTDGHFALATGGVSGASIASVAPQGGGPGPAAEWVVTVSTGSGNGSLGLNLTGTADLIGPDGIAVAPGSWTGPAYTLDRTLPSVSRLWAVAKGGARYDLNALRAAEFVPFRVTAFELVLSEPVTVATSPLTGLPPGATYSGSGTNTLTWTFPAVQAQRLTLTLDPAGVTDDAGNALQTARTTFRLNVLWGDVTGDGRVTADDLRAVQAAVQAGGYDPLADINGNGALDSDDYAAARRRLGSRL